MRLLYLSSDPGIPVLGHKGASVHIRELVAAFASLGTSVVIASPRVEPEGDRLDRGVELLAIPPVRAGAHTSTASLRQAIAAQAAQVAAIASEYEVDGIYERLALFGRAGVHAAGELGLPHVLEVNAPLREEALRFRSLHHAGEAATVEAEVYARTDHVFAVSEAIASRLVRARVPRSKITIAPNGIDPLKFPRRERRRHREFTVGFAGSLKPWHGVAVLLDAFARAVRVSPSLRLEIVGTGPERAAVAAASHLERALTYHGALPHVAAVNVMSRWDAGLAPYLPIPDFYFSPLKVAEYMAAGACPVASDLGQIRTLLGDGERGVLVAPGDASALADAILELAADRARAAELGERARSFAVRSLTWRHNAEQALGVLHAISTVTIGTR